MANLSPIAETSFAQSDSTDPSQTNINLPTSDTRRTSDPAPIDQTPLTEHSVRTKQILDSLCELFDISPDKSSLASQDRLSQTLLQKPFIDLDPDMQKTITSISQGHLVLDLSEDLFQNKTLESLQIYWQNKVKSDPVFSLPLEEQKERLQYYTELQTDLETRYPSCVRKRSETE